MEERIRKKIELTQKRELEFWEQQYPSKSRLEKIKFWVGGFNQSHRWAMESGIFDERKFTKEDYQSMKLKDSSIDELLPEIIDELNLKKDNIYRPKDN